LVICGFASFRDGIHQGSGNVKEFRNIHGSG
jgi:hypothetical protein